ncbi:MAG: SAM-dependent chlorinase/fluorinase [Armatimonadetes bacterium]|nr:SAM-dependent chlorinase/fluorinase [Armatimonadota bacterium]
MTRARWQAVIGVEVLAVVVVFSAGQPVPPAPAPAPVEQPANGLVVLLTDYGSGDQYPGILKGAVLTANPDARVIDATHDLPNFDVWSASYLLSLVAKEWPPGTTFVVVVDPGVGSSRKRIAVETLPDGKRYVGPDNGVFTEVMAAAERVEVHELTNPALARPGAESSTFHGRDWFGPVGGHLAGGVKIEDVGPALSEVVGLPLAPAQPDGATVRGAIRYADHYGNLLTNLPERLLGEAGGKQGCRLAVTVAGKTREMPWVKTYSDVPEGRVLVTINSSGCAEIAVNKANAAEALGAKPGMRVELTVVGSGDGQPVGAAAP